MPEIPTDFTSFHQASTSDPISGTPDPTDYTSFHEASTSDPVIEVITGPEGPSAYEVAVENGFTGTEEEWLASLVGPQGPQGSGTDASLLDGQPASFYTDIPARLGFTPANVIHNHLVGDITGGAAITKTDDTNVTLTLGGAPTTAVLTATSFTLGWTGTLAAPRGGTGFGSYAVGDILYASTTSALSKLTVGSNNYVLTSNGTTPGWTQNTGTGNVVRATQPQFNSTIGVGTAASASGSGVSFPATQSASTDPNTLDDYEEGTWTPTITPNAGSGLTTSGVVARYTKIGNLVVASFTFNITNNGTGSGYIKVSTPPGLTNGSTMEVGVGLEYAATGNMLQISLGAGGSTFNILTYNNAYPGGTGYTITGKVSYYVT